MNGRPTGCGSPSTVTRPSSITSSSADCVLGEARLISSASTMVWKIGPGWNSKVVLVLVVDRDAGDVGGQQVGGELDPRVAAPDGVGQRPGQHRLAGAGHVLQQDVPLGEQAGQGQPHDVPLARARPSPCCRSAGRRSSGTSRPVRGRSSCICFRREGLPSSASRSGRCPAGCRTRRCRRLGPSVPAPRSKMVVSRAESSGIGPTIVSTSSPCLVTAQVTGEKKCATSISTKPHEASCSRPRRRRRCSAAAASPGRRCSGCRGAP